LLFPRNVKTFRIANAFTLKCKFLLQPKRFDAYNFCCNIEPRIVSA